MIDYDKVILDLCGGTGAWSKPYREAGYTVHNITLPEYDLMKCWKMEDEKGKFLMFRKEAMERPFGPHYHLKIDISEVYGILAAPDCTHFSIARNTAKTPRDIPGAFELVKKCLEIIWTCSIYGNLKFWCLENPKGLLMHLLGKPPFKFERWEFGDQGAKMTHLWGDLKFPKKKPQPELRDTNFIMDTCYNKVIVPEGYKRVKGEHLKKIKRAITPPGFANAFFRANR